MSKPTEKIGLYGGSFDPIHNGHLILARDAMERLELDKVIFLPARISPHKLDRPPAPPEVRCQMLSAAIAEETRFEMDACEIEREGPSFTIDTVQSFRARHPQAQLYYFIGDDNVAELELGRKAISFLRPRSLSCSHALGCHSSHDFQPSPGILRSPPPRFANALLVAFPCATWRRSPFAN